ncbi:MAG: hypothetical protein JW807_14995 [Spirochaetes bacterium]|nr:hypothetical protein [Spirochaetota bacterium]
MKKSIVAAGMAAILLGILLMPRNDAGFHAGEPAFAACSAVEIMNNCCFKFRKCLDDDSLDVSPEAREQRAVGEFRRCLRSDLGCSAEMTEMKSKDARQIRAICR